MTSLGGGGTIRSLGLGYDTHGNLTGKTRPVSGDDVNVTGYGDASSGKPHRLTSATIGGVATSFHYDANGNITRYQATGADDTWLDYNFPGAPIPYIPGYLGGIIGSEESRQELLRK